jgi:pyruvate,water dikinase
MVQEICRTTGRREESTGGSTACFKNLLINNSDLLEQMTRMEVQLQDHPRMLRGLKGNADKLLKVSSDLVQNLNYLTEGSYTYLFDILRQISSRLAAVAREIDPGEKVPLVCSVNEAHTDLVAIVGGKAAPLGMLKNELNLPVPEGFVMTTEACQLFFEQNSLIRPIRDLLTNLTPEDLPGIDEVSQKIRAMIMSARIPQELRDTMEEAYEALMDEMGPGSPRGIAVRSSAIAEDGRYSFAGQFATVLNVTSKEDFFRAYKEVVASSFNENSLAYRLHRHMGFQEVDMAVLCLAMVPARSAGTLYTVDPNDLESERMILCSIWGLGEYLVSGRLPSDIFHISRLDPSRFELVHLAKKELKLVCDTEHGGTTEEAVTEDDSLRYSLDEEEIRILSEHGLAIEKYMGYPQDIEWAITDEGGVDILQARTLQVRDISRAPAGRYFEEMKLLMERGTTASKGLSTGDVALIRQEQEIESVKAGSILVAREGSSKIVKVSNTLRGIILERGNPLEHLACVAREYRIPMLVRATGAMEILQEGQVVTLDADEAKVYEGEAKLLGRAYAEMDVHAEKEEGSSDPRVEELRSLIFPLNLVDVRDPILQIQSCKSVHDIIRFCHEQGIQAMFEVNDGEYLKNRFYTSSLDVPIARQGESESIRLGGERHDAGCGPNRPTAGQPQLCPYLQGLHEPQLTPCVSFCHGRYVVQPRCNGQLY